MERFPQPEIPRSSMSEFGVADKYNPNIDALLDMTELAIDLERFAELPSRREALRAKDADNHTVFLSRSIAKKLYRCPCCTGDIPIGSEHVVISRVQMSKSYTHHHLDFSCTHETVLPSLRYIQIVDPKEAAVTAMNKRRRRYRNKQRRDN